MIRPDRKIICCDWLTTLRCGNTLGYKKDDGIGCDERKGVKAVVIARRQIDEKGVRETVRIRKSKSFQRGSYGISRPIDRDRIFPKKNKETSYLSFHQAKASKIH
jgi:hypothetical protein